MKMKKCILTLMFILFFVVISSTIVTLSISANEQAPSTGGVWAEVCCGSLCGIDYCTGTGVYKCCK